jgi:hypothetical protein
VVEICSIHGIVSNSRRASAEETKHSNVISSVGGLYLISDYLQLTLQECEKGVLRLVESLFHQSSVKEGEYKPAEVSEEQVRGYLDLNTLDELVESGILRKSYVGFKGIYPASRKFNLDKGLFCRLAYQRGDTKSLRSLIESDLPETEELLTRRVRLMYRLVSKQETLVRNDTYDRVRLPQPRSPPSTDDLMDELRKDSTLKAYELFDRVMKSKTELAGWDNAVEDLLDKTVDRRRGTELTRRLGSCNQLDGRNFEKLVHAVLTHLGFVAKHKGRSGETDILVSEPAKILIECKCRKKITSSDIREAMEELHRHGRKMRDTLMFVVTNHPRKEIDFEFGKFRRQDVRVLSSTDLEALLDLHQQYNLSDIEALVGMLSFQSLESELVRLYGRDTTIHST